MHSWHTNTKFTSEEENENKVFCLDFTINKEGALTLTLFQKKTFSCVYSNFLRHLPVDYKKGWRNKETLLCQVSIICSNYISKLFIIWSSSRWMHFRYFLLIYVKFFNMSFVNCRKPWNRSENKELFISLDLCRENAITS